MYSSSINVGSFGVSEETSAKPRPGRELSEQFAEWMRTRRQHGTYDAARDGNEYKNIWLNADSFDADSANSPDVRHKLISRSRYEIANNGYADGIAQTYATDLVGLGPSLRMQTNSEGFNRMVELSWFLWTKATQFRRKLWCLAHAKHSDGEGIGVLRKNKRVRHPIPLDVVLYEAEQCQTPYLPFAEPGYIDGIKFDEFGNPVWYDLLHQHPGTSRGMLWDMEPERVPADRVLHWFKLRRPGQHRGVPEGASTLNIGAAARRFRESTLAKADNQAEFTVFLTTQFQPEELDVVTPMSTLDIQKRMMTALPNNTEATQLENNTPGAQYDMFMRSLISEQARPKCMPYNRAAADSSGHNFASGKLDFMPYFDALRVDREDCSELVLDRTFETFFDLAVIRFGWLGGNPDAISAAARIHSWDWPELKNADEKSDATAKETKLTSGQLFLHQVHQTDLEDEIAKAAVVYGVDEAEIRKRLLDINLPPVKQAAAPATDGEELAAMLKRRGALNGHNGNGVHHG